ncbi:helix-turn-helix domain-containing protein [Xanthomonas oryzae]|uniref:helix-turn-helix domain-containing protein n=1 Tax=Xanthomonas oryzae TaxID=347 RepID=UPI001F0E1AF9|nr:helix-turn-helix transcriptional regulator [Xanthomonas oryzae]
MQGIERRELAAKTGVGYSTLSELERGGMQTTTKLRVIADALGVSLQWLETGKGRRSPGIPVSPVLETEKRTGDYVRVDQLDGDAGMGEGRINDD